MNSQTSPVRKNAAPDPHLLGHYAGFASRLIAFIIDMVLLIVIIVATGWFMKTTFDLLQMQSLVDKVGAWFPLLGRIFTFLASPWAYSFFSLLFVVAYYVFFWTVAGQTIGKGVMGLRIVPLNGGRIKAYQALIRYLGYYVSAVALGLGFLAILVNDRRLGWHDRFARTCVIYVWDARPDERFLVGLIDKLIAQNRAIYQVKNRFLKKDDPALQSLNGLKIPELPETVPAAPAANPKDQS